MVSIGIKSNEQLRMELISVYSKFSNVGGAQKMCLSIHKGLLKFENFEKGYIASFDSYGSINTTYKSLINKEYYLRFNAFRIIKKHPEAIYLSHHRKTTTILVLMAKLLIKKLNIIHVAHNEFFNLKYLTFFPKNVIAVSNGVKSNHESYFKIKNIRVIYNGIVRPSITKTRVNKGKIIKILISGRVNKVKQQLEVFNALKSNIPNNIRIIFAGTGELYNELLRLSQDNDQVKVLGHISNMEEIYLDADYIMLYSLKEGLPLALIEGTSYGLPILCNDVGGNLEILNKNKNGFEIMSLEALPSLIEKISEINVVEYKQLSINSYSTFTEKFEFNKMIISYRQYILENVRT